MFEVKVLNKMVWRRHVNQIQSHTSDHEKPWSDQESEENSQSFLDSLWMMFQRMCHHSHQCQLAQLLKALLLFVTLLEYDNLLIVCYQDILFKEGGMW